LCCPADPKTHRLAQPRLRRSADPKIHQLAQSRLHRSANPRIHQLAQPIDRARSADPKIDQLRPIGGLTATCDPKTAGLIDLTKPPRRSEDRLALSGRITRFELLPKLSGFPSSQIALFAARFHGTALELKHNKAGVSATAPQDPEIPVHSLPATLRTQ
jgi:hypothetical protein